MGGWIVLICEGKTVEEPPPMPVEAKAQLFHELSLGPTRLRKSGGDGSYDEVSRGGKTRPLAPLNAVYYEQRASAGLIISEATQVSPLGRGVSEHTWDLFGGAGDGVEESN
jgi:hypothetical protein